MSKKAAHLNVGANCLKQLEKCKHKDASRQDLPFRIALEVKKYVIFYNVCNTCHLLHELLCF